MKKVFNRIMAVIGIICMAWVAITVVFFVIMTLAAGLKTVQHDGQDSLSQLAAALFNLPVWAYMLMAISIGWAVIYIVANKKMLTKKFITFCEYLFDE